MIDNSMTVSQLRERLDQFDPELRVISEGCDCFGNVVEISVYENLLDGTADKVVILWRGDRSHVINQ